MAEQGLDGRSVLQTLRRHRRVLVIAAVLGEAAGLAFLLARPPGFQSTSMVLLAPETTNGQPTTRDMDTEIRIASSGAVLDSVREAEDPRLSRRELDGRVEITSPTSNVIAIRAGGPSAAAAERLAATIADSLVNYHTKTTSSLSSAQQELLEDRRDDLEKTLASVESEIENATDRLAVLDPTLPQAKADATALSQLTAEQAQLVLQINALETQASGEAVGGGATILESALPAERPHLVAWYVFVVLLGALVCVVAASVVVVARSRRDSRLLSRDAIADALGRPVLASLPAFPARDPAGWKALLTGYVAGPEADLALRQALLTVGVEPGRLAASRSARLTVVTLSDDPGGLAVGPQLAAHAAGLGVRTRLVVLAGHPSSAPLEAACSTEDRELPVRPDLYVDTRLRRTPGVELSVIQVTVDRTDLDSLSTRLGPRVLIAVSAGTATQRELAQVAVWTYNRGGRVLGAVVANPDALDRTSGRLLHPERAQQVPLPARMTGSADKTSEDATRTRGIS